MLELGFNTTDFGKPNRTLEARIGARLLGLMETCTGLLGEWTDGVLKQLRGCFQTYPDSYRTQAENTGSGSVIQVAAKSIGDGEAESLPRAGARLGDQPDAMTKYFVVGLGGFLGANARFWLGRIPGS
jgi:hypothetical protein